MTARGPAIGTRVSNPPAKTCSASSNKYEGQIKAYGIYDRGLDILGGNRGQEILVNPISTHLCADHSTPIGAAASSAISMSRSCRRVSACRRQLAAISDRNFLEQYFPNEFMNGPNQEIFPLCQATKQHLGLDLSRAGRLPILDDRRPTGCRKSMAMCWASSRSTCSRMTFTPAPAMGSCGPRYGRSLRLSSRPTSAITRGASIFMQEAQPAVLARRRSKSFRT